MPKYKVTIKGRQYEEWVVEADNEIDAEEAVINGEGQCVAAWESDDWDIEDTVEIE